MSFRFPKSVRSAKHWRCSRELPASAHRFAAASWEPCCRKSGLHTLIRFHMNSFSRPLASSGRRHASGLADRGPSKFESHCGNSGAETCWKRGRRPGTAGHRLETMSEPADGQQQQPSNAQGLELRDSACVRASPVWLHSPKRSTGSRGAAEGTRTRARIAAIPGPKRAGSAAAALERQDTASRQCPNLRTASSSNHQTLRGLNCAIRLRPCQPGLVALAHPRPYHYE